MREEFEVLSALVDGEPVDPVELERALALPGARRAVVELADLRYAFAGDRSRPAAGFTARVRAALAAEDAGARRVGRGWRWAAVAAVLALALSLPLWLAPRPAAAPAAPPEPDRVLRFEPGSEWVSR